MVREFVGVSDSAAHQFSIISANPWNIFINSRMTETAVYKQTNMDEINTRLFSIQPGPTIPSGPVTNDV